MKHFLILFFLSALPITPSFAQQTSQNSIVIAKNSKKNIKKKRKKLKKTKIAKVKKQKKKKRKKRPSFTLGAGNGSFLNLGYHLHAAYTIDPTWSFIAEYQSSTQDLSDGATYSFNMNVSGVHLGIRQFLMGSFYIQYIYLRDAYDILYTSLTPPEVTLYYYQPISFLGASIGNAWDFGLFHISMDWGGYVGQVYAEEAQAVAEAQGVVVNLSEFGSEIDLLKRAITSRPLLLKMTLGLSF